jgi:hypothetical protein
MDFFTIYRKRGFSISLQLLNDFPNHKAKEADFFQKLKDNESYLNEFYRVKQDLLDYRLLAYELDENYNKVVKVTEKGLLILDKIKGIEDFLKTDNPPKEPEKKKK